VISVAPVFVDAEEGFVDPDDVVISGAHFADDLLVRIGNYTMASADVNVVDSNTIEVDGIPAPDDFDFSFNTELCLTDLGLQGIRAAPTPVNVTVINFPGACEDTLAGGLIYEPLDTTCFANQAVISTNPAHGATITFDTTPQGSCSADETVIIQNLGDIDMDGVNAAIINQSEANTFNITNFPDSVVAPDGSTFVDVEFCPQTDDGGTDTAQLLITSNCCDDVVIDLEGQEQP